MNPLITIFILCSFQILTHCALPGNQEGYLGLTEWEVNIGNGWQKTKPVPWETSSGSGGIDAKNYDGFGEYRTYFRLTPAMKKESLAFFTESLDDADETYLNGHLIGQTGSFPPFHSLYPKNFRSATRESRTYVLPKEFLSPSGKEEILIKIYDYAGLGGFSYSQIPVIGKTDALIQKEKLSRWKNDLPRTFALSFLLILGSYFFFQFSYGAGRKNIRNVIHEAIAPLAIWTFFFAKNHPEKAAINEKISARFLLVSLYCFMAAIFLANETTYKYIFINDESFFFKIPTLCFVIGITFVLMLFHPDVFGKNLSRSGGKFSMCLRGILGFISHPVLMIAFLLYLTMLPPNQVWNIFTLSGVGYGFFTLTILFAMTSVNLIKVSFSEVNLSMRKKMRKEGFMRGFVLIGMVISNIFWFFIPALFNYSFLIMVTFSIIYLSLSIAFTSRNRISLPINLKQKIPISKILQQDYYFTITETKIGSDIASGRSRAGIAKDLKITPNTLKKHLQSIYSKVEEKNPGVIGNVRDKLQRLTVFLNGLK